MRHLRVSNNSSTYSALYLNEILYFVMQQLCHFKIIKLVSIYYNFVSHFPMTAIEPLCKTFHMIASLHIPHYLKGTIFWKWVNFLVLTFTMENPYY